MNYKIETLNLRIKKKYTFIKILEKINEKSQINKHTISLN